MSGSELELSEQFRQIAEIGGDVAWIMACPGGQLAYVSPAVETMLGYSVGEVEAQCNDCTLSDNATPIADLCAGLPERLRRFADGDLSRKKLVRQFETLHKDGRAVAVEVVSTLSFDANGTPVALVGLVRDISAQYVREEDLVREQRRFASMLNHEFRTPLSTIDGAIQRLEVTGANADDATRARYRKIQTACDRLIEMLDEYLSPERMAAIGRKRQPDSIAPTVLLEEGAQQVRAAAHAAHLELGDLPAALRCEPAGLRLALKVLVDNAVNFSPLGSPITLLGRRADGGVEFLVRDAGPGVDAVDLPHIFDKFYRGGNAATVVGSGLGLYMARAVVDVHGGSMSVRNMDHGGAEFRIWLPAQGGLGKTVAPSGGNSDNHSVNQLTRLGAGLEQQ